MTQFSQSAFGLFALRDSASNSSSASGLASMSSAMDAYQEIARRCDQLSERDKSALMLNACVSLAIYCLGIVFQLAILPANWRLSLMRSAFLFIFFTNLLDIFWLLEYVWLCAEFLFGARLRLPFAVEAFPFRFINFSIDAFYVLLAINRSMAVVLPVHYSKFFTPRASKQLVVGTFAGAAVYTAFINWFPEQRPFHCLAQLGYIEPTTQIPKQLLDAQIPDTTLYIVVEQVYLVMIYIPITFYIATFAYMAYNYVKERQAQQISQTQVVSFQSATVQTASTGSDQQRTHANLVLERTRLYLLCVLSTLPYYASNSLDYYTRIFDVSPNIVQVLAFFWQLFGTVFHVQQPLLMLWLSKDLRMEVRKDILWLGSAIAKRMLC